MNKIDFSTYKFRCSGLSNLMVEPKTAITELQLKKIAELQAKPKITDKQTEELARLINKRDNGDKLSASTKIYLMDIFVQEVYGRHKEYSSKYTEKGNYAEEDSLTLVSNNLNELLIKNKEHLENEYIKGTPDLVTPKLREIKSCWNLNTFIRKDRFDEGYYWQLQGYMKLKGITEGDLIYTLVSTPEFLIVREKSKRAYMDMLEEGSEEMAKMETQVELEMTFDDIPANNRMKVFSYQFDPQGYEKLIEKIKYAREFLNKLTLN